MDASGELALGDEEGGSFVGDNFEVVRATGVRDVDRRRRPVAEDNGPLLLSHGDVLGVVVPGIAEGIELSLKFVGDGGEERIVGVREARLGAEEGEGLVAEEVVDFAPDPWSDGGCVGHGVVIMQGGKCL